MHLSIVSCNDKSFQRPRSSSSASKRPVPAQPATRIPNSPARSLPRAISFFWGRTGHRQGSSPPEAATRCAAGCFSPGLKPAKRYKAGLAPRYPV